MDNSFKRKIAALRGEAGKKWLQSLPDLVKKYEKQWNIKALPPFPLSYNYVCPAETTSGSQVVLKISFPDNKEFEAETEALNRFNKDACIKVLKSDLQRGVVLLERATPGQPLSKTDADSSQITITSQVLKKLHKPISKDAINLFPSLTDWAKAFRRYESEYSINSGPVPKQLFSAGKKIFEEFIQDNNEQVLLHGDLHNDNILLSQRGWLVIDPKGVIGEREFELGAFLRNPYYDLPKGSNYKKLEQRRIIQFSEELGFDRERIRRWSLASAVISMLWFLEDEGVLKKMYIRNAELLDDIKV